MTPMIDLVFLLIIFFIVSSSLVQQEAGIPVDLPEAGTGEMPQEEDKTKKIVITVLGEDAIMLGTQPVTLNQLREYLLGERQSRKELKVRIRADRKTPYSTIEPIMVACIEAGIPDVVFSVTRH